MKYSPDLGMYFWPSEQYRIVHKTKITINVIFISRSYLSISKSPEDYFFNLKLNEYILSNLKKKNKRFKKIYIHWEYWPYIKDDIKIIGFICHF